MPRLRTESLDIAGVITHYSPVGTALFRLAYIGLATTGGSFVLLGGWFVAPGIGIDAPDRQRRSRRAGATRAGQWTEQCSPRCGRSGLRRPPGVATSPPTSAPITGNPRHRRGDAGHDRHVGGLRTDGVARRYETRLLRGAAAAPARSRPPASAGAHPHRQRRRQRRPARSRRAAAAASIPIGPPTAPGSSTPSSGSSAGIDRRCSGSRSSPNGCPMAVRWSSSAASRAGRAPTSSPLAPNAGPVHTLLAIRPR